VQEGSARVDGEGMGGVLKGEDEGGRESTAVGKRRWRERERVRRERERVRRERVKGCRQGGGKRVSYLHFKPSFWVCSYSPISALSVTAA
jgi:hypothetical protein